MFDRLRRFGNSGPGSERRATYRDALVVPAVDGGAMLNEKLSGFDVFNRIEWGVTLIVGKVDVAAWEP